MLFAQRRRLKLVGVLERRIGPERVPLHVESAAASNSVSMYPWLKVAAFLIFAASSAGMGSPVL